MDFIDCVVHLMIIDEEKGGGKGKRKANEVTHSVYTLSVSVIVDRQGVAPRCRFVFCRSIVKRVVVVHSSLVVG